MIEGGELFEGGVGACWTPTGCADEVEPSKLLSPPYLAEMLCAPARGVADRARGRR